jgi:hypothetical protein
MKRRTLPALLVSSATAALTVYTAAAPAAHAAAPPEPELVAESINDGGVYVDSEAKLFATDAAKDRLRAQLKTARKPVYVAVLPAGSSMTPAQLSGIVKRKGTFAVLNGGDLKASSSVLPPARLRTALDGALQANRSDPAGALVSFVRLTNGVPRTATAPGAGTTAGPRAGASPEEIPTEGPAPAEAAPTQAAAPRKDDGGSSLPLIGGAAAAVIVIAAGGFVWWRRRKGSGEPVA